MTYLNRVWKITTGTKEYVGLCEHANFAGTSHFGTPTAVLFQYYDSLQETLKRLPHIVIPMQQVHSIVELEPKVFLANWVESEETRWIRNGGVHMHKTKLPHLAYKEGLVSQRDKWWRISEYSAKNLQNIAIWDVVGTFESLEEGQKFILKRKPADWYTEEEMNTSYEIPGYINWEKA